MAVPASRKAALRLLPWLLRSFQEAAARHRRLSAQDVASVPDIIPRKTPLEGTPKTPSGSQGGLHPSVDFHFFALLAAPLLGVLEGSPGGSAGGSSKSLAATPPGGSGRKRGRSGGVSGGVSGGLPGGVSGKGGPQGGSEEWAAVAEGVANLLEEVRSSNVYRPTEDITQNHR